MCLLLMAALVAADDDCALYLAPSQTFAGTFGLYAGRSFVAGDSVGPPDVVLPLMDVNNNEWSPWHDKATDFTRLSLHENRHLIEYLLPGVGMVAQCAIDYANLELREESVLEAHTGVHRNRDPTAGSFSYYSHQGFAAVDDIAVGQELFLACERQEDDYDEDEEDQPELPDLAEPVSFEWLHANGICLDRLDVGPSTLPKVGQGAFTRHAVQKDQIIVHTPLLHLDDSQVRIPKQHLHNGKPVVPLAREHGIDFDNTKTVGFQVWQNYCFRQPDSSVLLMPYGPVVNYINHDAERVNAAWRWTPVATTEAHLQASFFELMSVRPSSSFLMELVALRDLEPGEEIFVHYGEEWHAAWEKHSLGWSRTGTHEDYQSAHDYMALHPDETWRVLSELEVEPYPANLRTACFFGMNEEQWDGIENSTEWMEETAYCLRPCTLLERRYDDNEIEYDATVLPMESIFEPEECGPIYDEGMLVTGIPASYIRLIDRPYTSDLHLKHAFRHAMSLPEAPFPDSWRRADPNPDGDFLPVPLEIGQMHQISWRDSGDVVTPWAFRIGLPRLTRRTLLDYCNKLGVTDVLRHATIGGNPLDPGTDTHLRLNGDKWYLQRPDNFWTSNLHWLSPADENAQKSYLETLHFAGFDRVLKGIGEHLGLNHLVAYHVTFIAVSQSYQGYMHHDVSETGGRAFNVIIPLLLANETGPELDLLTLDGQKAGRYRYEYHVASMMGDDAEHATSACDYRHSNEMRLAATVYVAEVDEDNVDRLLEDYTQIYPPVDRDLLLSWAGMHWQRGKTEISLPTLSSRHILNNIRFHT